MRNRCPKHRRLQTADYLRLLAENAYDRGDQAEDDTRALFYARAAELAEQARQLEAPRS